MNCNCCSNKGFQDCCEPFLSGAAKPQTAEQLMRSRFSAYATVNVEYLLRSTHPSTRHFHRKDDIEAWARANEWIKLEILSTTKGDVKDVVGTVEFKAFFREADGQVNMHHERSSFKKELGKWFFLEGKVFS